MNMNTLKRQIKEISETNYSSQQCQDPDEQRDTKIEFFDGTLSKFKMI